MELQAQQIPIIGSTAQKFRTVLGGQAVSIESWYQPVDDSWFMSLSQSDITDTPIATGMRLLEQGIPLAAVGRRAVQQAGTAPDVNAGFAGQLLVDGAGQLTPESWGNTHRLLYLSEEVLNG